jgi:hypothetical protein
MLIHFNVQRVNEVHLTGAVVNVDSELLSPHEYLSAAWQQGAMVEYSNGPMGNPPPQFSRTTRNFDVDAAKVEVTRACTEYLEIVAKAVASFESAFASDGAP